MKRLLLHHLAVSAAALLLCTPFASAQKAGFDLLQTASGAYVELGTAPGFPPGAIKPGNIQLKGVPICTCAGNADTIMHRTQDMPQGGGPVLVNVFALFMKNSDSVTFQGQPVDVYITINNSDGDFSQSELPQPDTLDKESGGTVTIRPDGTFDSKIAVYADLIIVKANSDVKNPANYLAHQKAPDAILLQTSNSTWSSNPPAGYPLPCFPAGGFYPVPVETGPHPVTPPTTTTPPGTPPGARCVAFNPATSKAEADPVTKRWSVVDGGRPLIDFGPRQEAAIRALAIIQHYHANQFCSVGSPNVEAIPPFEYLLVSGSAPTGSIPDEDCNNFDPLQIKIETRAGKFGSSWTIVEPGPKTSEGLSYFLNKTQADQAFSIIRKYQFTRECFVGRHTGGTLMLYFRK